MKVASTYARSVHGVNRFLLTMLLFVTYGGVLMADTLPAANGSTYPLNVDPAVKAGLDRFYNLDYEAALQRFEAVLKTHPQDPMANAYVLTIVVFRELYNQDLLDTTYYAREHFLTSNRKVEIGAGVRQRVEDLTNGAIKLSDDRIKANPNDKDAYFARSYAKGIHAAFTTFADHSFSGAARQGLSSRSDSEAALKIDPTYVDAKMAVGIQQFAVASLPRWVRFMVGIAGIGGNKEKGLELLRECQRHGTLTRVESMTALSLFLRHDGRYGEAIEVADQLAKMYPHNYLYRIEVANLNKDAGHGPEAIAIYKAVFNDAAKPGYFADARLQLAYFGLAETERGQGDAQAALGDYLNAENQPKCSDWMKKRAALNAGMMYDLLHQRAKAVEQYRVASASGGDQSQADAARKLMDKAYTGK